MKDADEYRKEANEETLLFVQIETPEAVENASAILETPGIDGIYIGNADLANFMNHDAKAGSANVQKVVDDLIKMATGASIPIGLPTWSARNSVATRNWGPTCSPSAATFLFSPCRQKPSLREYADCSTVAPPSHRRSMR